MKVLALLIVLGFSCHLSMAQTVDSLQVATTPQNTAIKETDVQYADSIGLLRSMPQWARKYLSSLMRGNVDRTHEKALDLSFAITPSYTREAGFGIGGAATGLYRMDRNDSIQQPSDVFVSLNASLNGFFVLTFKGNNLFPDQRSRLSYKVELYRKALDFWGITSEETAVNPKSKYDRRQIDLQAEYIYRLTRNFFIGAQFRANYTDARNIHNPEYLLGERPQYYVTGIGASFEFDTRDNLLTPTRGVHIAFKPMLYAKPFGNAPATFYSHSLIVNGYIRMWKGSVLALDWYTKLNSSNTPWTMKEMLASDGIRMRGYYMGSYMDNDQIAAQVELRQHVWRRLGFTVWGGGATVFHSVKELHEKNIRPEWLFNCGVGIRFEFKHNVNARIDYGFGKNTSGLVFAIGEAF